MAVVLALTFGFGRAKGEEKMSSNFNSRRREREQARGWVGTQGVIVAVAAVVDDEVRDASFEMWSIACLCCEQSRLASPAAAS